MSPMNTNDSSAFPIEVYALVAGQVTRKADLLQLRAVSAALRELSDDELFRNIRLTYPVMSTAKLMGVQAPHIARCVHSISYNTDWDNQRSEGEQASLAHYASLLGNLRIYPRLRALRFEYTARPGWLDLEPSTETLSALSRNCLDVTAPITNLALSSFELAEEPPDPAAIASLPPALFSQLTRLRIHSVHTGGTWGDPACDVLWNRLYPTLLITPARHTLAHLDLNFQQLIPVFPHHPDLVCPALRVLQLRNVVFGVRTGSTESFILRHARTLEELNLRDSPMLLGEPSDLPLGGPSAWITFWHALRESAPKLARISYAEFDDLNMDPLGDVEEVDVSITLQWNRFCYLEEDGSYLTRYSGGPAGMKIDWMAFRDLRRSLAAKRDKTRAGEPESKPEACAPPGARRSRTRARPRTVKKQREAE